MLESNTTQACPAHLIYSLTPLDIVQIHKELLYLLQFPLSVIYLRWLTSRVRKGAERGNGLVQSYVW